MKWRDHPTACCQLALLHNLVHKRLCDEGKVLSCGGSKESF
jgi:hypothetical protein